MLSTDANHSLHEQVREHRHVDSSPAMLIVNRIQNLVKMVYERQWSIMSLAASSPNISLTI